MTPQSFSSIRLASDMIRELGGWRIDAVAETVKTIRTTRIVRCQGWSCDSVSQLSCAKTSSLRVQGVALVNSFD